MTVAYTGTQAQPSAKYAQKRRVTSTIALKINSSPGIMKWAAIAGGDD